MFFKKIYICYGTIWYVNDSFPVETKEQTLIVAGNIITAKTHKF